VNRKNLADTAEKDGQFWVCSIFGEEFAGTPLILVEFDRINLDRRRSVQTAREAVDGNERRSPTSCECAVLQELF
jgi:hypothetical protein